MAKPKKQTAGERRKKLMKDLNSYQIGRDIEGYREYAEKMNRLDALMQQYSTPNSYGAVKDLDGQARETLLKAMRETAEAGEKFMENAMAAKKEGKLKDLKKGVPGVVGRLQGMLRSDQEALEQADPTLHHTLPNILENARSSIVFLDQAEMKNVGGAQNSRIPITFKDRQGEEHRGVFTKASTCQDCDGKVRELLERAADNCPIPAGKEEIRNLLTSYREANKERLGSASDTQVFQEIYDKLLQDDGYGRKVLNKEDLPKVGLNPKNLAFDGIKAIGNALTAYHKTVNADVGFYINGGMLGISEGARIDNRNSAMSAVAKLLGNPGLIAKSVNMKFVDQTGKVQEGTFMDYAEGVDLGNDPEASRAVNEHPFNGDTSYKALRELADLQVLDYICGNVDRHQGNMMYKTDEKGNVVGVQGIDNDSSFGLFAESEKNRHILPGADHLNVISASMRKKVMGLTPAMLKYSLRGRGLTEEELDFAAKRLTTLQESIRKGDAHYKDHTPKGKAYDQGFLRTVTDQEFKEMKIDQLYRNNEINFFRLTHNRIQDFVNKDKRAGKKFDPEFAAKQREKKLPPVAAAGRGFTGGNLLGALRGASKLVEDKDKKFKIDGLTSSLRGSSPQFDKMVEAAKKVAQLEKELLENPQINVMTYEARRREIDEAVEALGETNDAYLDKKLGEKHVEQLDQLVGKNKYEQDRIDHAKKIREFVGAYKSPQPFLEKKDLEGLSEQDRVEIRTAESLSEAQDRAKFYRMMEDIHRKHGLASPDKMMQEHARNRAEAAKRQNAPNEPVNDEQIVGP